MKTLRKIIYHAFHGLFGILDASDVLHYPEEPIIKRRIKIKSKGHWE